MNAIMFICKRKFGWWGKFEKPANNPTIAIFRPFDLPLASNLHQRDNRFLGSSFATTGI